MLYIIVYKCELEQKKEKEKLFYIYIYILAFIQIIFILARTIYSCLYNLFLFQLEYMKNIKFNEGREINRKKKTVFFFESEKKKK